MLKDETIYRIINHALHMQSYKMKLIDLNLSRREERNKRKNINWTKKLLHDFTKHLSIFNHDLRINDSHNNNTTLNNQSFVKRIFSKADPIGHCGPSQSTHFI